MNFKTTLNDADVVIEYEPDDDGDVNECEVIYQGKIITPTVSYIKYCDFLCQCIDNLKDRIASIKFDNEFDRGQELYEAKQESKSW